MLMREQAEFDLALRLRSGTAGIGDIYAFISGLYFRGKLAYTAEFGAAPPGIAPAMVIVPGMGLVSPETILTYDQLQSIANVPVDADNPSYSEPFLRDVALLPCCRRIWEHRIFRRKPTAGNALFFHPSKAMSQMGLSG